MSYALVLRTDTGRIKYTVRIPTLDVFETKRALKRMGEETALGSGDHICVENAP